MSCSTYTVRSCSLGGKPSTLPLAMARMRVDCTQGKVQRGKRRCGVVGGRQEAGTREQKQSGWQPHRAVRFASPQAAGG